MFRGEALKHGGRPGRSRQFGYCLALTCLADPTKCANWSNRRYPFCRAVRFGLTGVADAARGRLVSLSQIAAVFA